MAISVTMKVYRTESDLVSILSTASLILCPEILNSRRTASFNSAYISF